MNLYLIAGDDTYEKNKYIEKIKAQFPNLQKGINWITLDKDNISSLEQELSTYSFLGGPKLILVKIPKKTKEDAPKEEWLTDRVLELLENGVENTCVLFVEEGTSKGKLTTLVQKKGEYVLLEKSKKDKLVPWVMNICKENNVVISLACANYLISICGTEKQVLYQEINKLLDYVGKNNVIDEQVIDKLCIKTSEIIIFDLTDALGKRNIQKSLQYLEELNEPLQKTMIMITKHFKMLYLAKIAEKEGKSLVKELGTNAYAAKKYTEQARNFTEEELWKIFDDLCALDIDSKLGKIDLKIGIEKILMSI